jgi:hypothetical protein
MRRITACSNAKRQKFEVLDQADQLRGSFDERDGSDPAKTPYPVAPISGYPQPLIRLIVKPFGQQFRL